MRFSGDARIVELVKDRRSSQLHTMSPDRSRLQVGDQTIVALGTVFMVEYVDRQIRVAMVEGRVAVVRTQAAFTSDSKPPSDQQYQRAQTKSAGGASAGSRNTGSDVTGTPSPLEVAAGSGAIELSAGEELRSTKMAAPRWSPRPIWKWRRRGAPAS